MTKRNYKTPLMTYNHMEEDLTGLASHYVDIRKEKKSLSVWYVVYEEVIILSLITILMVTAI